MVTVRSCKFFHGLALLGGFLPAVASANPLAASTVEILVRASLQTTTHATAEAAGASTKESSEATTDGSTNATKATSRVTESTSDASSSKKRRYHASSRLHPTMGAAVLREAYNLDGPNLKIIADGLGVKPKQLARAIMASAPLRPTEEDLVTLLAYAVPVLKKRGHYRTKTEA